MPRTRRVPQRQCVACGGVRAKRELLRVVRTPDGAVVVDPTGKLSGRGAYVCAEPGCVERAVREERLSRLLRRPIPPEVVAALENGEGRPRPPRAPVVRRVTLSVQTKAARAEKRQGC